MGAQQYVSPRANERTRRATEFLHAQGAATTVWVVGASREAASALVRGAHDAVFGWQVTTLRALAGRLATPALAASGQGTVAGAGLEAIAARLVHRLAAETGLGRFARLAQMPGLPRALLNTFAELRAAEVAGLSEHAPDLVPLLAEYERELERAGLVDRAGVMRLAIEGAKNGTLLGAPMVLVDPEVRDAADAELIRALAARASEFLLITPQGDERALFFEPLRDASAPTDALARVQHGLFDARSEPAPHDGSVVSFSAPGESRESVEIVRRVLAASAAGLAFDRMAVVLHAPSRYRAHLVEAFRRAEVPVRFSRGAQAPDPSGRALLALLDCRAEGYSARAFGEYLSLGVVPGLDEGAPPEASPDPFVAPDEQLLSYEVELELEPTPLEALHAMAAADPISAGGVLRVPRRWESLLVDAAVIGGRERWARRLTGLENGLRAEREHAREPDEPKVRRIEQQLEDLANLRRFALPVLEELAALPGDGATWGAWIDALSVLSTRVLREPDRVLQVIAELGPMRDVGPVSLAEVRLALGARLRELLLPRRAGSHGVFVCDTREIRGRVFERVFVPGLAERVFPARVPVDPILHGPRREALGLRTREDRVSEERMALRLAVGAATREVVFSWPRLDLDHARARVPSFYALEIERAAVGRLPDIGEFERRAYREGRAELRWPAPTDASQAIDAAEYDLATLRTATASGEPGAMAYLHSVSEFARRSLGARARRWDNPRGWTHADGLVLDADSPVRGLLDQHRVAARRFSATALQKFAACPYQFYLNQILRLDAREVPEPIEDLDALQRGSLIHEIQFRTLLSLREEGRLPLDDPQHLARAFARLSEVTTEVAAEWNEQVVPAIARVWTDAVASIEADCRAWLQRLADERWLPTHFELAFGMPNVAGDRDPASRDEPVELAGGLKLRGSIDLVEEDARGGLRASDYKTGRASAAKGLTVEGGKTLQPVLYALALEGLFPEREVVGGRLDYCTTRGGFEEREVALTDEARGAVATLVETLDAFVETGFLPALPRDEKTCEWCDYLPVCGPHEAARTRTRKPQDKPGTLQRLRVLRELP